MITYKVTYDVTIPVYDGTTNGQLDFLRPTTFKGMLRFWWRALVFGRFHNILKDNNLALEAMKRCENHLFGSSDQKIGQARLKIGCLISIENAHKNNNIHKKPGIDYFTGQGMGNIPPLSVSRFEVTLRLKDDRPNVKDIAAKDWELALETLDDALVVLGLIGGLGKKSRKGFGSLSIQKILKKNGPETPFKIENAKDYKKLLTRHLGDSLNYKPDDFFQVPFTCINGHMSIHIVTKNSDPINCLQQMGWAYKYHRSNGTAKQGKNNNGKRVVQFDKGHKTTKRWENSLYWDDHQWMEAIYSQVERHNKRNHTLTAPEFTEAIKNDKKNKKKLLLPKRIAFGLPHNYFSKVRKDYNKSISVTCINDRRASPLYFHVQKTEKSKFGVITIIPADFPEEIIIKAKIFKDKNIVNFTAKLPLSEAILENMQVTYDQFLDCFTKIPHMNAQLYSNEKNKPQIAVYKEILPEDEFVTKKACLISIIPGKETGETPDEQNVRHD